MKEKKSNILLLLPIVFCIGFIPLIVHYYQYDTNFSQFDWYQDTNSVVAEIFLGWKMIATILAGVIILGIMIYKSCKKKNFLKYETAHIGLLCYGIFVLMSALFSPYKYWLVRGSFDLLEPVWVVFAFVLLCFYIYCVVETESQTYFILKYSTLGIILLLLIGALQSFGLNLLTSSFGQKLILNPSQWEDDAAVNMTNVQSKAYATLHNPNYLSFYAAIIIMLFFGLIVGAKKTWEKVVVLCGLICAFICLWGSGSISGCIALVFSIIIVFLVLMSRRKKTMIAAIGLMVVGMICTIVLLQKQSIQDKFISNFIGTYKIEDVVPVKEIETRNDGVMINIEGNPLVVSYAIDENGYFGMTCKDETDNIIPLSIQDEATMLCTLLDSRYEGVSIQPVKYKETYGIQINYWGRWIFIKDESGVYKMRNFVGKLVDVSPSKASRLFYEDAFSGRGRIWNNTISLLSGHIILGSGANTFALEYPQDDIIYKTYRRTYESMDVKAHCWYLQQWVEEGLLALICLLVFITCYLISSIRIIRKISLNSSLSWIAIGIFGAVTAFLMGAIVNDAMAGIPLVFWGLLGLGFVVNRLLRARLSEMNDSIN